VNDEGRMSNDETSSKPGKLQLSLVASGIKLTVCLPG
jgi:hypothetical protein